MLVIIHFRKYHIWNMRRKRTDQSISWRTCRNFTPSSPACSKNSWQTGGKQADKAFKRWNDKAERNTGFEDRAGNFSGNKIGSWNNNEQTAGVRSRSDCETKPNQSSVVFTISLHRGTIKKCSQKVGFTRKTFDTKISRHDTKIFNTVKLKRTV